MSREIRRVPIDFDWPLKKTWGGYLIPTTLNEIPCSDCYQTGSTPAMQWIDRVALMLDQLALDIDIQAAGKAMHPWLAEDTYPPVDRSRELSRRGIWVTYETIRPSADVVEFVEGLMQDDPNERSRKLDRGPFGQNKYAISRALLRAARVPDRWGMCLTCDGHGSVEAYEGQRAESEAWECTDPPTGDGWQVWETTSEGSPISPVFADREGVIGFLMSDRYYGFGTSPTPLTREQAGAFVDARSSIGSFLMTSTGEIVNGDAALSRPGGEPA